MNAFYITINKNYTASVFNPNDLINYFKNNRDDFDKEVFGMVKKQGDNKKVLIAVKTIKKELKRNPKKGNIEKLIKLINSYQDLENKIEEFEDWNLNYKNFELVSKRTGEYRLTKQAEMKLEKMIKQSEDKYEKMSQFIRSITKKEFDIAVKDSIFEEIYDYEDFQ